jgi:6,7-dimethyl-8-ribityllumazine synthase
MKKIHIIVSEFNNPIPEQLLQGALRAQKDAKFTDNDIINLISSNEEVFSTKNAELELKRFVR